ncbi:MAG: aminotransferase class IV [Stigonema ocellatum SAG 48.90 = DSM 106950]|nr:aminotransferase class IV [Stigonema ocellatum SAG 48.90 = DSM 106950]
MGQLVNLDGVIAPTASVSVLDRSFLYGDSIYEVVRTFGGKPFGLQEHLDRLRQSAAYLYLDIPWDDAHIQTEIERTLQQAGNSESYIRIVVTRGAQEEIGLMPSPDLQPHLVIIVRPISPERILPQQGIRLRVVPRQRVAQLALNPAAKTGNYLNNILALLEARQNGADDALMLNSQGELTEATTSNLWLISQGVVRTPAVEAGILHGITRYFLLKLLRQLGIPHEEISLRAEAIWSAEEAFLSSSVRLLMPVAQIDDYSLPKCPGPMTRTLWQGLLDLMQEQTQYA